LRNQKKRTEIVKNLHRLFTQSEKNLLSTAFTFAEQTSKSGTSMKMMSIWELLQLGTTFFNRVYKMLEYQSFRNAKSS